MDTQEEVNGYDLCEEIRSVQPREPRYDLAGPLVLEPNLCDWIMAAQKRLDDMTTKS